VVALLFGDVLNDCELEGGLVVVIDVAARRNLVGRRA
jgi:hypothetical protein